MNKEPADKNKILILRKKIDSIDKKLILLLSKRFKNVEEIGRIKKANSLEVEDIKREKEIEKRIKKNEKYTREILEVYRTIFKESKKLQK